jgi:hypothetical protein
LPVRESRAADVADRRNARVAHILVAEDDSNLRELIVTAMSDGEAAWDILFDSGAIHSVRK